MFGLFGSGANAANLSSRSASHSRSGGQPGPAYDFPRLQQLYDRLSRFKESDLEKSGGGDAVVETVRQITEALIWGEQNDAQFFDFFCEKSILADFVRVLALPKTPKKVKLQLLQTLQILVQNIRQKTSVYYLLSNNHVNRLITTPLDFSDEEVLAYYITLMKSLALRLDTETIKFFFVQRREATFPLYTEATKLFGHRDQMVRATVRTITLQVYSVNDEPMQQFVLRHAAESYFSQLALHLRDLWLRLDVAVAGVSSERDLTVVQGENELQQDLQIYLSDVFELGVAALNEVLADRLLNCVMLPVLLSGLAPARGAAGAGGHGAAPALQRGLAPAVALFLLRQVLDTFRSPVLLGPLLAALLRPHVPAALAYVLPECAEVAVPPAASSPPDFVWNSIRKHFLAFLTGDQEAHFLLSSAVLHGCVVNRAVDSEQLLGVAGVLHGDAARAGDADAAPGAGDEPGKTCAREVLLKLPQALSFHTSWHAATLRVHASILLDTFLGLATEQCAEVRNTMLRAVRSCVEAAADRFMGLLQASISGVAGTDGLLDVFAEEWELNQAPLPDVQAFCGDPRRLLPCSLWAAPRRDDEARGAAAAFLLLRRLLAALEQPGAPAELRGEQPRAPEAAEPTPLQMDDQDAVSEGMSYPIGNAEKIVCGVASPNGKCTRYLLLHDYWLLLVQPDLAAPGWARVKTVQPIWQVQSIADRSDPRTLQLGLPAPFGSRQSAPDGTAEAGGELVTMSLNFEDVQRAHAAAAHLQRRRREVRVQLLHKAVAFVEACLARRSPEGAGPPAATALGAGTAP